MRYSPPFRAVPPPFGAVHLRAPHPSATNTWSKPHVSVRLACLMHAASVNPEPGSNSPKIAQLALRLHPRVRPLAHPSRIFLSLFSCQGAASGARQTAAQTHHDGTMPP